MKQDVEVYDRYDCLVRFEPSTIEPSSVIASFIATGSNQNCPKIALGDVVYMRNVEPLYGYSPDSIEIQAVIINYKLVNESVKVAFTLSIRHAKNRSLLIEHFSRLKWQIRFTYND